MITVRKLINHAVEIKAKCNKMTFEEAIRQPLYFTFYTNSGVHLVISMNSSSNKLNKNNVFRKVNIEVLEGKCIIPEEMNKYQKYPRSIFSLAFCDVPERIINQCFTVNSGVDLERFTREWEKILS